MRKYLFLLFIAICMICSCVEQNGPLSLEAPESKDFHYINCIGLLDFDTTTVTGVRITLHDSVNIEPLARDYQTTINDYCLGVDDNSIPRNCYLMAVTYGTSPDTLYEYGINFPDDFWYQQSVDRWFHMMDFDFTQ